MNFIILYNNDLGSIRILDGSVYNARCLYSEDKQHRLVFNKLLLYDKAISINIDTTNLGSIIMSNEEADKYRIYKIYIGNNQTTSKRALIIEWYADGSYFKSYIDITNESLL